MNLTASMTCEAWIDDDAVPTGREIDFDIADMVRDMSPEERAALVSEVSKPHGRDLDFVAERAGVIDMHDGPFTVRIDEDDLIAFIRHEISTDAETEPPRFGG